MIGGHTEMSGALLDHLEHGIDHADDRAEGTISSFVEATRPVEVTEQLVGAVDQVDDHARSKRGSTPRSPFISTARRGCCVPGWSVDRDPEPKTPRSPFRRRQDRATNIRACQNVIPGKGRALPDTPGERTRWCRIPSSAMMHLGRYTDEGLEEPAGGERDD